MGTSSASWKWVRTHSLICPWRERSFLPSPKRSNSKSMARDTIAGRAGLVEDDFPVLVGPVFPRLGGGRALGGVELRAVPEVVPPVEPLECGDGDRAGGGLLAAEAPDQEGDARRVPAAGHRVPQDEAEVLVLRPGVLLEDLPQPGVPRGAGD